MRCGLVTRNNIFPLKLFVTFSAYRTSCRISHLLWLVLEQPSSSFNHQIYFGTALKMRSRGKTSTGVQYSYLQAVSAGGSSPWQWKKKVCRNCRQSSKKAGSCRGVLSQLWQPSPERLCSLHPRRVPRPERGQSDLACPHSSSCSKQETELSDLSSSVPTWSFLRFFPPCSDSQVLGMPRTQWSKEKEFQEQCRTTQNVIKKFTRTTATVCSWGTTSSPIQKGFHPLLHPQIIQLLSRRAQSQGIHGTGEIPLTFHLSASLHPLWLYWQQKTALKKCA